MTTQPAYLTLQSGTQRYLTQAAGTNYYLTLQDPAPYDNDVALLLAEATWYIDAHAHDGSETIVNMGTAGTALNALNGGGTAVTTNDATWLPYSAGTAYIYLSGIAGNNVTTTAPALTTQYAAYPASGGAATTGAATAGASFTYSTTGSWRKIDLLTAGSAVTASFDCSLITAASATSLTDAYGVTWTVNRSTSGRKTTLVGGWAGGGSLWLLGTDDYLEVPDNDAIDFGASDSFTVLAVVRQWATPVNNGTFVNKYDATNGGWLLRQQSTLYQATITIRDASANTVSDISNASAGAGTLATYAGVVDRSSQLVEAYADGSPTGTPSDSTTVGSLATTNVMRVGRQSAATAYEDFEFTAAAIWRRALTATEIAGLSSYFTTRAYSG